MTFSRSKSIIRAIAVALILNVFMLGGHSFTYASASFDGSATANAVIVYGNASLEHSRDTRNAEQLMKLYDRLRIHSRIVSLIRVDDYRAGQIQGVTHVFLYGLAEENVNASLGADLRRFSGVIGWIGGGLERYSDYGLQERIAVTGYSNQFTELIFGPGETDDRNETRTLIGETLHVPKLAASDGQTVQRFGWLSDGQKRYPYALHADKLWVISAIGENVSLNDALSRMLDQMFDVQRSSWPNVLLMLNNVSPFIDLERLQSTAEWLYEQGVPFIVELRPVFANTEFKQMQRYFEVIREVQQLGGTAVLGNLQGWYPPDAWNTDIERYSETNVTSPEDADVLIALSLQAYLEARIYPLAFTGPMDLLFDQEYVRTMSYFSTFVQKGVWKGYVSDQLPEQAWAGNYVSDKVLLQFDSSNDWEGLQATVERRKKDGATFDDFRNHPNKVSFVESDIASVSGEIRVDGQRVLYEKMVTEEPPEQPPAELSGVNRGIKQTMSFIFIIAGLIVGLFLLAFVAGKRIDRKKHLR